MAKSDVTQEEAQAVIDRVAQELGLLVNPTSGFMKVQSPGNKHRIYVQRSKMLNRIDTTLPLATDDPAYKALAAPNGSIVCHITPTLEQLERCLRMLGDKELATQVPNKPRPFAATKQPAARKPKPVVAEVPLEEIDVGSGPVVDLKNRIKEIHTGARKARIRRWLENDPTGTMTEAEATQIADGKMSFDDFVEAHRNEANADLSQTLAETGIEVAS